MKFFRLIRLIVFRNIKEEKYLTFLSILGVALGLGLFVGVKTSTDRAVVSFEEHVRGINPRSNYEIVDMSGIDFDESIYGTVRRIEENSFPVLQVSGYIPEKNVTIDIRGVDTIRGARFIGFKMGRRLDMENYYKKLDSILITQRFSDRQNLNKGDVIKAYVYNSEYTLKVADVLNITSLPPNIVFMDIGNLQEYFGKTGFLTKIDLSTDDQKAQDIQRILPSNLLLEGKKEVIRQQNSLIASFRYNLQFITFLAVLVGVFMLYNTIFISVVKRRTEIGVIRALGMNKRTVVFLFTIQGLIHGFAGSFLGIFVGQFFSYFSVMAVEKTVSTFHRSLSISDYLITGSDALRSLILGLFVSFLASAIPALESARIHPYESSMEGSFEKKYMGYQKIFSLTGLFFIIFSGFIVYLDYIHAFFNFPYLTYTGILLFILGCTFNAPVFLSLLLKVVAWPARRLFRAEGKITVSGIEGSRYRFSVALMSVAISSALIVALLSSIFSMKKSFKEYLHTYLIADAYIKPSSCRSNYCFDPLPDEVLRTIERLPEVEDIGKFRALHIDFRGKKVIAGFGNTAIWRKYSSIRYPGSEEENQRTPIHNKIVSASDYLKVKYDLHIGDEIEIHTPKGKEIFSLNYTSISYSTTSGFIYLDRMWLNKLWGLDDATQLTVYLKEGSDVGKFIEKLNKVLSNSYSLSITDNAELRRQSIAIFEKSFALTYAIELIAIIISLIGVINTLLILVFEKKREISIIRYLGGSWRHITRIMVLSAGIIGIAGIVMGSIMGPVISMVIIHVINKISFGWEVSLHMPFANLLILMAILFIITVAAGILPSHVAKKIDPQRFISFE
jgi:putative ABC transport system permease protein